MTSTSIQKENNCTCAFLNFYPFCHVLTVNEMLTEGDLGSILRLGRSPVEGNGYPLQYSGPENSINLNSGEEIIMLFENQKHYTNV